MLVVPHFANVVGVKQLLKQRHQPHGIDRLLQIVTGAQLERFDRARHRPLARDEHRGRRILGVTQLPNQIDAARTREMQIGDDYVDRLSSVGGEGLLR